MQEVDELSNETEKINLSSENIPKPQISPEPTSLLEQVEVYELLMIICLLINEKNFC